jgi:hypothetical protein
MDLSKERFFYFKRAVDFRRDTALAHREVARNPYEVGRW